jgi:hypothetical protein
MREARGNSQDTKTVSPLRPTNAIVQTKQPRAEKSTSQNKTQDAEGGQCAPRAGAPGLASPSMSL